MYGPLVHPLTEDCLGDRAREVGVSPADEPNPSPPEEARTPPSTEPQHRVSAEHDSPLPAGQEVETKLQCEVIFQEELRSAQQSDPMLEKVRERIDKVNSLYFWDKGLLMRQPYHMGGKNLILIPQCARMKVLQLAHSSLVGTFGIERTLSTIRHTMDRPGVAKDVKLLCESCTAWQKAKPAIVAQSPLQPLPIMTQPFERIAMDIFGPWKRTASSNCGNGLCHKGA